MTYTIVDPASIDADRGPHPAASPFDKRLNDALGLSAFGVYQVELPAGAETVRHDHRNDGAEDLYVVLRGEGRLLVEEESVPIRPGQFIAVTVESSRQIRAGDDGLLLLALCATPSDPMVGSER
jgi:uncharacterized cupin superfamily protein